MKAISEMTIEELQDYAVSLEESNSALKGENEKLTANNTELTDLNKALQKRNNDLFMKVEQSIVEKPIDGGKEEEKTVESCEDFAKKLILGDK